MMKQAVIGCVLFGCVMAALQSAQYGAAVVVVAAWVYLALRNRATRATGHTYARGHSHPGPVARVALHEGGHLAAIRRVGGRITDARVSGNDRFASGYAVGIVPDDPASVIGVMMAGRAAAPDTNSDQDMRNVRAELGKVPAPYRGHVMREAQRIADAAASSSDARCYANRLERRGRL